MMLDRPMIDLWKQIAVVSSLEQATAILNDHGYQGFVILCIDVPRCKYVTNLVAAQRFYEKKA